MHNKSFTADGVATIIGGRNVGDEYFGAAEGVDFADLDVLAIGLVVESTALSNALHDGFDNSVPKIAYEVRLNNKKQIEWVDRSGAEEKILTREPATGGIKRGLVILMCGCRSTGCCERNKADVTKAARLAWYFFLDRATSPSKVARKSVRDANRVRRKSTSKQDTNT